MRKTRHLKLLLSYVPVALLLLLAALPVGKAADIIPDSGSSLVAVADTVVPSDVENVKATSSDGSVTLSWNVATDNVGVKGYKLYYGTKSVGKDGTSYEKGPVDMGNKISYTLTGLTNGQKYYFAVTAYDAGGNESESYSLEVSATPAHGAADNAAPKVAKTEAVTSTQVRVTFSEAVQLPSKNPESAFTIKNDGSGVLLQTTAAVMDPDDTTHQAVLLTTAKQQAGASYILTAGIAIQDTSGNPIVSGTSDTAPFTGTDVVAASAQPTQQQSKGPSLKSVSAMDSTHVDVVFSEPVTLKADGRENFIITEEQNIENTLDIQKVELSSTKTRVTLTTAPQKAIKYNLIAVDVANNVGATISVENNATTFTGMTPADGENATVTQTQEPQPNSTGTDTTPPEDASHLVAAMIKEMIVTLSWDPSKNSANDLVSYVLYTSTDGKNYGQGVVIDPNNLNFDITDILPKVTYFFKLTARDASGNESKGITTTFRLAGTGPELGLFFLGALGAGKVFNRKKRKNLKK